MTTLRKKLIRLAHSNPELQPHVLPLLKTATLNQRGLENLGKDLGGRLREWSKANLPRSSWGHEERDPSDAFVKANEAAGGFAEIVEMGYAEMFAPYKEGFEEHRDNALRLAPPEFKAEVVRACQDMTQYMDSIERASRTASSTRVAGGKVYKAEWDRGSDELVHPAFDHNPYWGGPGDDGGGIYDWSQTSDDFRDGDILEWKVSGKTYRVYMHRAWPTQIAGPQLGAVHRGKSGWSLKVIPFGQQKLIEPEYM